MSDIEKLFKDKLQHHPVTPPAEVWETLQGSLQQQQKKKTGWWWMAASIALLVTIGAFFYLNNYPTVLPESSGIANKPAVVEPIETESPNSVTEFQDNSTTPIAMVQSKPLQAELTESSTSAAVQTTAVVTKVERMKPVIRLEVNSFEVQTSIPKSLLRQKALITVAEAPVERTPTVTIIYKSGRGEVKEESITKNPLKKAANFLASIKENGVGFSELRSAKSEIISKAFSSKRDPMPAE